MDWTEVALAGLVGGIAGGIGGILAWMINNSVGGLTAKTKQMITVGFTVLGFTLATSFGATKAIKKLLAQNSSSVDDEKATARYVPILSNPRFLAEIEGKSPDEIRLYMANTVHNGLRRLPLVDLMEWNRVRLIIANTDKDFCASLWTGKFGGDLNLLVGKLQPEDRDTFIRVTSAAAQLELENRNPFVADSATLRKDFAEIGGRLSQEAAKSFNRAMASGVNAEGGDACLAIVSVMTAVTKMPADHREVFLRNLSSL